MSLKVFHIIFIAASVLTCFFFGAWAANHYAANPYFSYLATAVGSITSGIVLGVYGFFFIKKTVY